MGVLTTKCTSTNIRPTSTSQSKMIRGAGFGDVPRQLRASDFGRTLPNRARLHEGAHGLRQLVLLECLEKLEAASDTAHYHRLAQKNLASWAQTADAPKAPARDFCEVRVLPGDWGEVTRELTREFGRTFAALNMANAFGPGGGYTDGMVAQEENMYRRTDCHFSLVKSDMDEMEEYTPEKTALISAAEGRVYLDHERPRVCIRGPEERNVPGLGYRWYREDEVFPFYELRAAACDLRNGSPYNHGETCKRVAAQLETLIAAGVRHVVLSAFGCGAFMNPAAYVADAYKQELTPRAGEFDVVAFAIFNAGYGPDNFGPFQRAFADWRPLADSGGRDESVDTSREQPGMSL